MALHEYRCSECQHIWTRVQPQDEHDKKCPWCGERAMLMVSIPAPIRAGSLGKGGTR